MLIRWAVDKGSWCWWRSIFFQVNLKKIFLTYITQKTTDKSTLSHPLGFFLQIIRKNFFFKKNFFLTSMVIWCQNFSKNHPERRIFRTFEIVDISLILLRYFYGVWHEKIFGDKFNWKSDKLSWNDLWQPGWPIQCLPFIAQHTSYLPAGFWVISDTVTHQKASQITKFLFFWPFSRKIVFVDTFLS